MKFETKYPEATAKDSFEFEYSHVTKTNELKSCRWCSSMTRWIDVLFQMPVCSEQCGNSMWSEYREHQKKENKGTDIDVHFNHVKEDLKMAEAFNEDVSKDIIIVVKDQLAYFKECIETIQAHTKNYKLFIWDNDSGPETKEYLHDLMMKYQNATKPDWSVEVVNSDTNIGFIDPNNNLAQWGDGDYIILINSDCKVFNMWDRAMISFLHETPDVAQVGFWGGHLGSDGRGFGGDNGYEIDYIPGWCFCISRETYNEHGLFNKQLNFAYCEDADFSLRLKEAGKKIYALHAPLVHHYQNKTITEVQKEGQVDVQASFEHNHKYIQYRWKNYLANERVLLKVKDAE